MGREDSSGVLMVGRGKVAGEGDPYVGIKTRTPHEDKILAQLVDTQLCSLIFVVC